MFVKSTRFKQVCQLTFVPDCSYVMQLDFERFSVEIVFLRPPWTRALRMRHRSGKTLLTRSRVHSVFPP